MSQSVPARFSVSALALGAMGVVFGDIGTSPLYTMKEVFGGHHLDPTDANVLGILSLLFWSLMLVVSLKYVTIMMRADNKGEGGILALLTLAQKYAARGSGMRWLLITLGFSGASLFFGDSLITPAISVLSAVEGLEVGVPKLYPLVLPLSLGIVFILFIIQSQGTATIGRMFGPVMLIWFGVLGILGLHSCLQHPHVLLAVSPVYAMRFFAANGLAGFLVLGAVVLAITGAEALYADMGHFGRRPIRLVWFCYVLPALLLNYFGQGALLLSDPAMVRNPFYLLGPDWMLYPLVGLASVATVIASQAVISGAFSVMRQAIQMGYAPRLTIQHTSARESGQIYIPFVNWVLLVGILLLMLAFRTSSNLAGAYGIAVTGTFAIDTILVFVVLRMRWKLSVAVTLICMSAFLSIDLAFFSANAVKIPAGGWFPLVVAVFVFTLLVTWKRGREIVYKRLRSEGIPLGGFLESLQGFPPLRVPGTAVFMTADPANTPSALLHNLKHNKVLHDRVIILNVCYSRVPYVSDEERLEVEEMGPGFYRLIVHYGFMDDIDIPRTLTECRCGKGFDMMETTFFYSREYLIPTRGSGMSIWREQIFAVMARNAASPMTYFNIPANRVVEMGAQVEI
jgi:KUP system potassium uptake protein